MREHTVKLSERELQLILAALDLDVAATPRSARRAELQRLERRLRETAYGAARARSQA